MGALSPLVELDKLHGRRDAAGALERAARLVAELQAAPPGYDVLWRAARVAFDLGDAPGCAPEERSKRSKEAWELARRAIALRPTGVEGHYWAALGIGAYGDGLGVVGAVMKGIEGKFTGALSRATELGPGYDFGNIFVMWGLYYLEMPWPKRDRRRAAEHLRHALALNPANLRAKLYLARLARDEDRLDEARSLLAQIAAAPVGRYDGPDERRAKDEAKALNASLAP
jgi:tetratricopeptide (TPR) repeat protein